MVAFQGGGLAPMLPAHKLLDPLGLGIVFKVDLDFDFRSSWGRFGLRLGGHFRSFWRFGRPKLVPKPSSNRFIFEKMIVHETLRFPMVFVNPYFGLNIASEGILGPKKRQLGASRVVKSAPRAAKRPSRGAQERPRAAQEGPKSGQERPKRDPRAALSLIHI